MSVRVELSNVWKEYGDHVVLERLNLQVRAREFCTIVGASGCGKTTLLRMLLGEELPTRGKILLDGRQAGRPGHARLIWHSAQREEPEAIAVSLDNEPLPVVDPARIELPAVMVKE